MYIVFSSFIVLSDKIRLLLVLLVVVAATVHVSAKGVDFGLRHKRSEHLSNEVTGSTEELTTTEEYGSTKPTTPEEYESTDTTIT